MTDSEDDLVEETTAEAAPPGVGPQLRAAREKKGLTLDQVASDTRISRRHLEEIEAGNFSQLPGRTYAVGFARTFAKTVGLDQEDVAAMVRAEMAAEAAESGSENGARRSFEPGDPNSAPGSGLLKFSLVATVILLVGIFFAARALFWPAADMPTLIEQQEQEEQAAATAAQTEQAAQADEPAVAVAPDASGEVVFTAQGETWVRFTDGGERLFEASMQPGDTYTLPATARDPRLNVGRPDLLAITIGGRSIGTLSSDSNPLPDAAVSAQALLARETGLVQTTGFGAARASAPAAGGPASAAPAAATTPASRPAPSAASDRFAPSPTPTPTRTAAAAPAATAAPTPRAAPSATPTASAEPEQAAPEAEDSGDAEE